MTDDPRLYQTWARICVARHRQPLRGEYVAAATIHTNTIEGFFSIFKRGMKGVYQHCGEAAPAPLPGRVRFPLLQPVALASTTRCAPSRPWRASAASASPIGGLTKPALEVKRAIREILNLRWIEGKD